MDLAWISPKLEGLSVCFWQKADSLAGRRTSTIGGEADMPPTGGYVG